MYAARLTCKRRQPTDDMSTGGNSTRAHGDGRTEDGYLPVGEGRVHGDGGTELRRDWPPPAGYLPMGEGRVHGDGGTEDETGRLQRVTCQWARGEYMVMAAQKMGPAASSG